MGTASSMECSIDYTVKNEEGEESKNQQEALVKKNSLKTPNSGVSCSSPGNGMRSRLDSAIQTSGIATDSSERLKESEKSTTTSQSNSPDEGSSKCSKNQSNDDEEKGGEKKTARKSEVKSKEEQEEVEKTNIKKSISKESLNNNGNL